MEPPRNPGRFRLLKIIEKILKKYELHRATVLDALDNADIPHSTRPYFFEIETDGSIVPLRPKHFRTPVAGLTFDVPPNALRRHMRTRLMEAGVAAQSIDAWMGHWLDALSPHDALSTFDHVKAMSEVKQVVEQVIQEMGWRAVSGWDESS